MVVTVYVRLKLSPQNIPSGQRIDEDLAVLGAVGGKRELDIKTLDRMSIPEPEPQIEDRIRPVATGLSEGHFKVTAGTGSVLLLYTPDSAIAPTAPLPPYRVRLSNNHVYAIQNEAELQDPIFQPGPHDGGTNNDTVGRLLKYVPIHFDGVTPNEVDAAIRSAMRDELCQVYGMAGSPQSMIRAEVGMEVFKRGRTTDINVARIEDVNLSVQVGYGSGKSALFQKQILAVGSRFSQGGDSGSAVFQRVTGFPWLGLLFAGNQDGSQTIVNHAYRVCELLDCELLVEGIAGEPPPWEEPPPGEPPIPPLPPGCGSGLIRLWRAVRTAWEQ
jgi:hypothetical protein